MKKLFLPILFLHLACMVNAATYYFSNNSGDDNRSVGQAQDPSTPWRSLDKLNSIMYLLQPGDQVLFKRGETYNGSINVTKSGSGNNPIVFDVYGTGYKPVITGFAVVTGWNQVRNNVWEADLSSENGNVNMVTLNNQMQSIGRYPNKDADNSGYMTIDSHNGSQQLSSSQLRGNWNGGDIVIRKSHWVLDRSHIDWQSGNTIGFEQGSDNDIADQYGFFIVNHPSTLDQNGEWYYDKNRSKLQVYFDNNNPNGYAVKGSSTETLVNVGFQSNITFNNLTFSGANSYSFSLTNSNNITINSCNIRFSGINGVQALSSSNVTISNCNIVYTNNQAINMYWNCSNELITNNTIKYTATVAGMGASGSGTHQGIYIRGDNNMIQYNEIDSTGSNGIHFEGDYSTVQNNFINYFGITVDDAGGIYTGQGLGVNTQYNQKTIANNIVLNGIGAVDGTDDPTYIPTNGIYLDENTNHVNVTGNTVANCSQSGIFNHNATYTTFTNNTMYNNGKYQFLGVRTSNPISYVTVTNNIEFSKTANQIVTKLESSYGNNNLGSFGSFDNNYYCRPIDDEYVFYSMYIQNGQYYTAYDNLDSWIQKFGYDGHSQGAPLTIPAFNYNIVDNNNIYPNGGYDQNIWNVAKWSPNNDINTSWNPNKLDGGTLQVGANNYSSNTNGFFLTLPTDNTVNAGQGYVLSFTLQGGASNKALDVYLKQQDYPNNVLTTKSKVNIKSNRQDVQLGLIANSSSRVSIEMDVQQPNGSLWLDNVTLRKANINYTNPDDYIVFGYNPGSDNKQINLPDGVYYDATGKRYNGTVNLKPYTSVVLIKDGGQSLIATSSDASQAINVKGSLTTSASAAATATPAAATDLTWTVDNQKSNATSYEVERSTDAATFSAVGTASVKTTADATVSYQFKDAQPQAGKNYYRIKQSDAKGSNVYSPVVMVNNLSFKLNPNPARDVVHVIFDQPVSAADHLGKEMVIRDPSGRTIQTMPLPVSENMNVVNVNVASLKAGMYILTVTSEGQAFSKSFLKQ